MACINPEQKELLEVCHYSGNVGETTLNRFRYVRQATLRNAGTGGVIDRAELWGEAPKTCSSSYDVIGMPTELKGRSVAVSAAERWLEGFVEP